MIYFQQTIIQEGKHSFTRTVIIKYVYYIDVLKNSNQQCIPISITQLHTKQAHSKKELGAPLFMVFSPGLSKTLLRACYNQTPVAEKKIPNSPMVFKRFLPVNRADGHQLILFY